MKVDGHAVAGFRKKVLRYYEKEGRHELPWRTDFDPYKILVSEIMLQQTQVGRVIEKFNAFVARFPGFESLAKAPSKDVLALWHGLGYNRRALFLHRAAQEVVTRYGGKLPDSHCALVSLPGIGSATAHAVLAYAFNKPVVYIETNIRSVFLHHFFAGQEGVRDEHVFPLVAQALDTTNPRAWYSALMDYGTMLKQTNGNASKRSAHYVRQSKFEGSRRQKRGKILKVLLSGKSMTLVQLSKELGVDTTLTKSVVDDLVREGFVVKNGLKYLLKA